jgi:hypothetical protein
MLSWFDAEIAGLVPNRCFLLPPDLITIAKNRENTFQYFRGFPYINLRGLI